MYQNPVLFPQISNRESWIQTIEIADDDTGEAINLEDANGNALYAITLEISLSCSGNYWDRSNAWPYYDDTIPTISATLADYLSIIDTGIVQIDIPKTVIAGLVGGRTYDVFMTIYDAASDDGRQILIGRLPVFYGGRNT